MNRRDTLLAVLLCAGLAAVLAPFAGLGVDPHHDGIMLKPALDVLSGQALFRDTFMQYGALTCYLQAAALWIQPSLLAVRFLTVAAYVVALFFLYAAWRQILPRSLTVFCCGLFILFIPAYEKNWLDQFWMLLPWSSVFALLFESLGLYALFLVIRGERPVRWGVVLGAACACVFWCRQPVGVIMAGCVAVIWLALLWTNWSPAGHSQRSILAGITGGFVAVNILMLGRIALSGAGPEWWYQNFVWPRRWAMDSVNVSLRDFASVFVHPVAGAGLLLILLAVAAPGLAKRFRPSLAARSILNYYLGLAAVLIWQHERVLAVLNWRDGGWTVLLPGLILWQAGVSIAAAFTRRGAPRPVEYYSVAALAALALGSLVQYYPVPDSWHILWSLAPGLGLFAFVFWRWTGWTAPVVTLVLTTALLPSVYAKIQSARQLLAEPRVTLTAPAALRGMRVSPKQAASFNQITAALQPVLRQQPDLPSALIGNDAIYLCFTANHANPSPYFVTWVGLADNADNQKRWANIQRDRPLMFLHRAQWGAVDDFYRRTHYIPLLYLQEDALEIAIPQELANAMGVTAYGAALKGGPAPATPKP